MNKTTIWNRITAAQVILVVLLLIGAAVVVWLVHANRESSEFHNRLMSSFQRLRTDLFASSDAMRGVILEPGSELEKMRYRTAETALYSELDILQGAAREQSVANAVKAFRDFYKGSVKPFDGRVMELLSTNSQAAADLYSTSFDDLRKQRDLLFDDIDSEVQKASDAEFELAQRKAKIGISCAAILFVAFILVGWLQASSVTKPLAALIPALERMSGGDFTQRVKLDRKDEFGIVGDGLNRLADDLSGLVGQVQRSGIQVNTTATEIAATAKEQQSTANEIAATTAEIGATSKEISATSRELVKTMNEVSQVAEDTAEAANTSQAGIVRMENNMRQIMEASSSITAKLAVLSEKTANINTVVTTITKVADQTNLLSLNAAIEAEKAGEYGLGFAVVAMEIRRLADQTAVATYDIEKMVKEMQSAVAAGVMGMDKFADEVRRGVEEIRQVSTQLAQIIRQVQTLTPRFHTVNEGMNAQATGAQQISETLIQLNEAAQQTAESLRQSNVAIEQLNEAAHGLRTSVARFKLEAS